MAKRRTPPTEFDVARGQRIVKRLLPKIAKLPPADQQHLSDIATALLVGTDEEADLLRDLMETRASEYEYIAEVARGIVAKHPESGE